MEVQVRQLVKKYGKKVVLNNISLTISEPGVYLIAGPNGSGKTTLLEIMVGLRKMDRGEVRINRVKNTDAVMRKTVGFLTQQNTLRRNCTVKEEIQLVKELFGLKADPYDYLKKYGLQEYYLQKTKHLSGGTQRRLLLAMVFLPRFPIIVLDEPVSGLDTFNRDEIWNMIREYAEDRIVIVSDHYLNQAAQYSDYVFLLNKGTIILEGKTEEILNQFPYKYVMKTRKKLDEEWFQSLQEKGIPFELKVSGSVYNCFLKNHDRLKEILDPVKLRMYPVDLEDIYFYYTGEFMKEVEDV